MTDLWDDDEPRALGPEVGERRRRDLRAAAARARTQRTLAVAPWIAAVLLGLAAAVAAWIAATASPDVPAAGRVPHGPGLVVSAAYPSAEGTRGQPTGLAVAGDRVYVADPRRHVVDVLSRDGSRVATFGEGVLDTPVYVAVGPVDGRVYVADRGLGTVEVFASSGKRFGVLDSGGLRPRLKVGTPWRPLGLAFAPDGTLYVADSESSPSIAVFDAAGSRAGTLGADAPEGRTGLRLAFPNGIAVTDGDVLVADSNNGRILVFTRAGAFSRAISVDGIPRGLAVTDAGRILVTNAATNQVALYGRDGSAYATLGGDAEWGTVLKAPSGVAVADDGTMYAADSGGSEIAVLDVETQRPAPVAAAGVRLPWPAIAIGSGLAALLALALGLVTRARAARARTRARAGVDTL